MKNMYDEMNKTIERIKNNDIKDKVEFRKINKLIRENLHMVANKREIIEKLDIIKYKVLYGME